jgi:hypothetical protein
VFHNILFIALRRLFTPSAKLCSFGLFLIAVTGRRISWVWGFIWFCLGGEPFSPPLLTFSETITEGFCGSAKKAFLQGFCFYFGF